MSTQGLGILRRCWNDTTATWTWPWRRTMLEKEPWTVLAAFHRFGKLGTMSNEYRGFILRLARVALRACSSVHVPSARKPTPQAARFLRTISATIEVQE